MQQELLIEIFCEEIPARFQKSALPAAKAVFTNILDTFGAKYDSVESYISCRRIAIRVQNLFPEAKDSFEEKRGPRIDSTDVSLHGFLKTNNSKKNDLIIRNGYYYLKTTTKGSHITQLVPLMIEAFIEKMPWPKSMKWYLEKEKKQSASWVRPVRSILCIYDGTQIDAFIGSVGINTCDYTYGHRFLSKDIIRVLNFDDYKQKLEKNHVIIDYDQKRNYIEREMSWTAAAIGLLIQSDEALLDEITGLVEYPFVHIGAIDEKFMQLPQIVLSTSMKVHQKYFTLVYPDSTIAPFFSTVTNIPGNDVMHSGLDRVLCARLSDAAFFFQEDTEVTLEAFTQRLSNVVFHEKLGSIAQKIDRMMSVAETKEEYRTIALCKADLLTAMVGEFPELQGAMGEIYARNQKEKNSVCIAIKEHYKPNGANDSLPETYTGARVAFFDKLDTLVGFLGIGIFPTGSKDPFALRRAGYSVVRLLCDFKDNILGNESLLWYIDTLINAYAEQGIAFEHDACFKVEKFIIDRLKAYMSDILNIKNSAVESIISSYETNDFCYKEAILRAKKLSELCLKDTFTTIQNAYKRAAGMIGTFETEQPIEIENFVFENEHMINLQKMIKTLMTEKTEESIIQASKAVLLACENVVINSSNEKEKSQNVMLLIAFVKMIKQLVGDIS